MTTTKPDEINGDEIERVMQELNEVAGMYSLWQLQKKAIARYHLSKLREKDAQQFRLCEDICEHEEVLKKAGFDDYHQNGDYKGLGEQIDEALAQITSLQSQLATLTHANAQLKLFNEDVEGVNAALQSQLEYANKMYDEASKRNELTLHQYKELRWEMERMRGAVAGQGPNCGKDGK